MSLDNLDEIIQAEQPTLSASEQADLWQRISPQVSVPQVVISPYSKYLSIIHSRAMTSLIIALIFILGAGGTVAVSEAAKPGDILFPIERATERARLAFASDERAEQLRADYADQRLAELLEIIEEEGKVAVYGNTSATSTTGTSTETITTFAAEADVYTDITVVEVEANYKKVIFTTATNTKAGVVAEIANRYDLGLGAIEAALDFEIENRASLPSERGVVYVNNAGEERISRAVNVLLDLLAEVDNESTRNGLLTALLTQIDNLSVEGRDSDVRLADDSKSDSRKEESRVKIDDKRVEVRADGYRIRVDKDGDVRVKQDESDDEDEEYIYYPVATTSTPVATSTEIKLEVEAKVFTDITEVKVELNGVKTNFVTIAKTKDTVAEEVAILYQVDKAKVLAVLNLKVEVGASIEDAPKYNDDDNEDESEDREDEDRDEDDDRDEDEDNDRDEDESDEREDRDEDDN